MTPERFRQWLDTCGADLGRWPEDVRAEAAQVLERSDEAAQAWQDTQKLDERLAAGRAASPDPDRVRAITNAALRRIRAEEAAPNPWQWLFSKRLGAAFASAAFAGLLAGFLVFPVFDTPSPVELSAIAILFNGGGPMAVELLR